MTKFQFSMLAVAITVGVVLTTPKPGTSTDAAASSAQQADNKTYPESILASAAGMSSDRFDGLRSVGIAYSFHAAHKADVSINFQDHTLYLPVGSFAFKDTDGTTWNYESDDGEGNTATAAAGEDGVIFKVTNAKGKVIKTVTADFATIREQFQGLEADNVMSQLKEAGIAAAKVYDCPHEKVTLIFNGQPDSFGAFPQVMYKTDSRGKHKKGFVSAGTVDFTDNSGDIYGYAGDQMIINQGQKLCSFNARLTDAVNDSLKGN